MYSVYSYDPSLGISEEYNLHGIVENSLRNIADHLKNHPNTSEFLARIRLSDGRIVFNDSYETAVDFLCTVKSGKIVCKVNCASKSEYDRFHNPTVRLLFKSTISLLKKCIEKTPQEQADAPNVFCLSLEMVNQKIDNRDADNLFKKKYLPGHKLSREYNNIALAGFFNSNPAVQSRVLLPPLSPAMLPFVVGERVMINTDVKRLGVLEKIEGDNLIFETRDRLDARNQGRKHNIFSAQVSCSPKGEYTIKALSQTVFSVTVNPDRFHYMVTARSHPLNEVLNASIYSIRKINKSYESLKEILMEKSHSFVGYFDAQKGVLISSKIPTIQATIVSETSANPSTPARIPVTFTLKDGVLTSQFDSNGVSTPVVLLIKAFSSSLEKYVSMLPTEIKAEGINFEDIAKVKADNEKANDEKSSEIDKIVRQAVNKLREHHMESVKEKMRERRKRKEAEEKTEELTRKTRKLSIQSDDQTSAPPT